MYRYIYDLYISSVSTINTYYKCYLMISFNHAMASYYSRIRLQASCWAHSTVLDPLLRMTANYRIMMISFYILKLSISRMTLI